MCSNTVERSRQLQVPGDFRQRRHVAEFGLIVTQVLDDLVLPFREWRPSVAAVVAARRTDHASANRVWSELMR